MFENNDLFGEGALDLGSDTKSGFEGFPLFGEETAEVGNTSVNETVVNDSVGSNEDENQVAEPKEKTDGNTEVKVDEKEVSAADTDVKAGDGVQPGAENATDLFAQAISQAEGQEAEKAKSSLIEKPPVFTYGNAKEEIVDTSKTFDALRIEKAEDFAELDDGTSVGWKMVYGTITKSVSTPKKTTIASLKKQIEDSNEFMTMLKKSKDDIVCKVTPTVTAKKKGVISPYKGVALSVKAALESGKAISYIPSDDGNVYEMRTTNVGAFISKAEKVSIFDKVRAGFIPALPKIPYKLLAEVISFFRAQVTEKSESEALVYVYWSFVDEQYYVYVPKQKVTKTRVNSTLPDMDENKFPLVMEIHSHNTMSAAFSHTDDEDEKATRLYAVVGRLDKVYPDIKVRASVGGKFMNVVLNKENFIEEFKSLKSIGKGDNTKRSPGFKYLHQAIIVRLAEGKAVTFEKLDFTRFTSDDLEDYIKYYESVLAHKVAMVNKFFDIMQKSASVFAPQKEYF